MSKCLYCQIELPEGYGMVCPSCEKDLLPHSGNCRKCLYFNYCTDKGNHDYCGCSKYFVDKDEYVKVVRCKDCCCSIDIDGICYCTYWSKNTDPMGYCYESC